jgi:hypothetical protein
MSPVLADFVAEVADESHELPAGVELDLGSRSLGWKRWLLKPMRWRRQTWPQTPPDASRHTWAGQRRRSRDELGQPAQVLRNRCQRELELGTARPAQSQAAEP